MILNDNVKISKPLPIAAVSVAALIVNLAVTGCITKLLRKNRVCAKLLFGESRSQGLR
jgi:hypothetical protein